MKNKENIQKSIADGEMGNRRVMSENDQTKLRKAYHCFGEENFPMQIFQLFFCLLRIRRNITNTY